MIDKTTKKLIIFMTFIVIAIMVSLVCSPEFPKIVEKIELSLKSRYFAKDKLDGQKIFSERLNRIKSKRKFPNLGGAGVTASNKPIVKLGISLPLTGDGSIAGNAIREALEIALNELPPDLQYEYRLVIEDNGALPTKYTTNRLVQKGVDGLLSAYNKDGEIVADFADFNKIPHISCAVGNQIMKKYNYSINHYPSAEDQAQAFLDNLSDNDIRIFSIVTDDNPLHIELVKAVEKKAKRQNFPILNKVTIEKGQYSYSKEAAEIAKKNPEAVMIMLDGEELFFFAESLNKTALKAKYTSIDKFYNFFDKSLINGAIFVAISDGDYIFKEDFRNKTVLPNVSCAAQMYDALRMYVVAFENLESVKDTKTDKVYYNLKRISNFPSATGEFIDIAPSGNIVSPMMNMKIERDLLEYK